MFNLIKPATLKIAAILLLLLAMGFGYYSLTSPGQEQAILIETYAVQPHRGGFQAHVDPDTGHFSTPSEAQKQALKQAEDKRRDKQPAAAARVYKRELPDGTKILDLEERYSSPPQ